MEKIKYDLRHKIGFFFGPLSFMIVLFIPPPNGMSIEALRLGAVSVLMAIWWITEAIPIPATALLPIALFPTLSIMKSAETTASYANHLIYLFLGGFFIAITMEKWNLHRRIALHTIRFVGVSPSRIILGFMCATAFLSMWISNTATAMMMLPIALAVIHQAKELIEKSRDTTPTHFNFATALMLGIAYSASIGGVGTIIGTPPNTILVGFIEKNYNQSISFAEWMVFGIPLVILMLLLSWGYLIKIALPLELKELPGGKRLIQDELQKLGPLSTPEKRILLVFLFVSGSWILRGFVKFESLAMVHDATIAIIGALLLFLIPVDFQKGEFLLDWESALKVPWDVIILFGGGLTLAHGFKLTGLANWIGLHLTTLEGSSMIFVLFVIALLTIFLTEITSNTASSAMLIPVMGSIALAMGIHPYGPIVAAGLAASYAFMLPVATPPNAVVFGSKQITIPQMARAGFWLNILGVILITLFVLLVLPWVWNIDLSILPEWLL